MSNLILNNAKPLAIVVVLLPLAYCAVRLILAAQSILPNAH